MRHVLRESCRQGRGDGDEGRRIGEGDFPSLPHPPPLASRRPLPPPAPPSAARVWCIPVGVRAAQARAGPPPPPPAVEAGPAEGWAAGGGGGGGGAALGRGTSPPRPPPPSPRRH